MQSSITDALEAVFGAGIDLDAFTFEHMLVRAVVIYGVGLALVRFGKNRLLGRNTGFDIVLAFILGSLLSRGINGAAPPVATLAAAVVLVLMHWLVSALAVRSDRLGRLLKGHRAALIHAGEIDRRALLSEDISENDLLEALRLNSGVEDIRLVRDAYIERNGQISTILRRAEPKVVEIAVREGVQTVRLELTHSASGG